MANRETWGVTVPVTIETRAAPSGFDVCVQMKGLTLLVSSNGHYPTERDALKAGRAVISEWKAR